MSLHGHFGEAAAAVAAGLSSGAALIGATVIHEVNEYLQAGAFIVAMVSGTCAALYYITVWRKNRKP